MNKLSSQIGEEMTAFFKKSKIPVSDLHSLNAFTVESLQAEKVKSYACIQ